MALSGLLPHKAQCLPSRIQPLKHPARFRFFAIGVFVLAMLLWMLGRRSSPTPNNAYIFTFWEPRDKMPGYVKLCLKTWKKYLSDYQIVVLDYSNLKQYLSPRTIAKVVCREMTLPVQADGIRVALLRRYGGIWMDADTIITSGTFLHLFEGADLGMFGPAGGGQNIGFIYANKNSTLLSTWFRGICQNVRSYKRLLFVKKYLSKEFLNTHNIRLGYSWNYLGNSIIDPLVQNASIGDYRRVNRDQLYVMPELIYKKEFKTSGEMYQHFYFEPGNPDDLLKRCRGIIMLHNSWTPQLYKGMSETQFLQQDILLAQLLSRILED